MEALSFRLFTTYFLIWSALYGIPYLLKGLALYRMAKNAGLRAAWLAWVPLASSGVLGSLCDRASLCLSGQIWYFRIFLVVRDLFRAAAAGGLLYPLGIGGPIPTWLMLYGFVAGAVPDFSLFMILELALLLLTGIALYNLYEDYIPERAVLFTLLSLIFGGLGQSILLFLIRRDIPYSAIAGTGGFGPRR